MMVHEGIHRKLAWPLALMFSILHSWSASCRDVLQNAKITCPRESAIKGTEREPHNNTENRHAPLRCRPLHRTSGSLVKMPDDSSVITCDRIVPTTHTSVS